MDRELLRQLYERYHRELYLYLYSLSRDGPLSEDLLQETFLKALLSLPEGHGNLRAWLYLVARNLYFSHRRREDRLCPLEPWMEESDGENETLERVLQDERSRLLYRALGELEGRRREILQMQYFGGLSQREIAAILHLTPENVRVLACRARRELRKRLEDEGYDIS